MRKNEQLIGAAAERKAVRTYLRRRARLYSGERTAALEIQRLIDWLNGRDERYRKAKGGLK